MVKKTKGYAMRKGTIMLTMCAMMISLWFSSCTLPEITFAEHIFEEAIDHSSAPSAD